MRLKLTGGLTVVVILMSLALATPTMALFAPHGAKGLKSIVENTTVTLGSGTIKCPIAKAVEGEINATGSESDIGKISWGGCLANGKTGTEMICSNLVLVQPNKEGTSEGKFTLTLHENCTAKVGGSCTVTLEAGKTIEKGIQIGKGGIEFSKFETKKPSDMEIVAKGTECESLGFKEASENGFAFLLTQEGVKLE